MEGGAVVEDINMKTAGILVDVFNPAAMPFYTGGVVLHYDARTDNSVTRPIASRSSSAPWKSAFFH
jgi:rRNA processing protein Gar1